MYVFCGTKFWDWDISWNTHSTPDFTICFEETFLVWTPCALLWIISIYEFYKIKTNSNLKPLPITIFFITKILLCLALIGISFADLIHAFVKYVNNDNFLYGVDFYTPFIKLVTFIYVTHLIKYHRKNGKCSSGILFIFWLLITFGATFNYRTVLSIIKNSDSIHGSINDYTFITKMIYFPILLAQLFISCFSDATNVDFKPIKYRSLNRKSCPEDSVSFLSKITFWWLNGMIFKGYKNPLTTDDMWSLSYKNITSFILKKFNKVWIPTVEKEKQNAIRRASKGEPLITNVSLLSSIVKTFWPGMLFVSVIKLIASTLVFVNPIVLDRLISYMSPTSDEPQWRGYFYASLMFFSPLFESLLNSQYEYRINLISMRIRACIISVIYKKSLKLSSSGRKHFTTGEIVTLMSVDSQRMIEFINMFNTLWSAPLQIILSILLLWQQLGIAALAGLIFMLLLVPFNVFITSKVSFIQLLVMKEKDKRVNLMNEILNGIKVLKLYAWENSFRDQLMGFRDKEAKFLKSMAYFNTTMNFCFSTASFFVGLISFATFVLLSSDNILDANRAFVSLSLFNIVRIPLTYLPLILSMGAMFLVSLRRVDKYLNADEIDENCVSHNENIKYPIIVENGSFAWSKGENPILENISIQIKNNSLVAIVGQVGSGKSSLISALLGDMEKLSGNVNINGSVAYVPQQAWIQNETLRQNIVFTSDYNEKIYNEVIESCALGPDLKILSAGDMTEIGGKGINLSGGQKQRISLARAVYSNSDIYLLDDPLSAVDAHVGRHLFEKVIGHKGVLNNKTRILVTHRLTVLPQVDQIIVLKDGTVSESGSFEDLIAKKGDFAELVAEYITDQSESDIDKEDIKIIEEIAEKVKPLINSASSKTESFVSDHGSDRKTKLSSVLSESFRSDKEDKQKAKKLARNMSRLKAGKLIEAETTETGSVKLGVYKKYIKTIGIGFCSFILFSFIATNVAQVFSSLWLSQWSNDALNPNTKGDTSLRDLRLGVYGGFGALESIFSFLATISLNIACIKAAKIIHNNMLKRIMRAPMSFFDTTPIGRILNRFSKDIDTVDMSLSLNLRIMIMQFFRAIVAFSMISLETPIILVVVIPMAAIYYLFQKIYISSSRQLKRIDSTSRSPIYNHFSETVNGSTSIRAYGVCHKFINESNKRVDDNHICYYPSFAAARWLSIRLEFLGYSIVFVAALFAVISRGTLSPGIAGLAISYSLNITSILGMFVRTATDVETNIVSVERCIEYMEIPSESEWFNEITKPNNKWPEKGEIKFNNYSTKYREGLHLVLKKITLEVNPNEKVGIVGRTGAGKSSLTLALFRLIEPTDGTIFIDNIDIRKLGLYDLRSRLTIIPQDPVLFTGTLRMNLDPFDQYSDNQIWNALDLSHLKTFVNSLEKGLSHKISEGGENLSVGQKQLVCLARALLRKTKILVLDEATAAVDMETDDLIQETIRKEFSDSTIVTIAHRLNTILDYDRVIVMDKGEIVEFDSPKTLLNTSDSIFYSMAKDANIVQKTT